MKTSLLLLLMMTQTLAQENFKFAVNFWQRDNCTTDQLCLPQALGDTQYTELDIPETQSYSQTEVIQDDLKAVLLLVKRDTYYSFQIELKQISTGETVALCSRYEGLDTLETSIVGSCGGRSLNSKGLIGVSLLIP